MAHLGAVYITWFRSADTKGSRRATRMAALVGERNTIDSIRARRCEAAILRVIGV
jgi:hypothetical protein